MPHDRGGEESAPGDYEPIPSLGPVEGPSASRVVLVLFGTVVVTFLALVGYTWYTGDEVEQRYGHPPLYLSDVERAHALAEAGDCEAALFALGLQGPPSDASEDFRLKYQAALAALRECWERLERSKSSLH